MFFTISYDKNNDFATGEVVDDTFFLPSSDAFVKGKQNLCNIGFDFAGWNTEKDRTGTHYVPGDSITMTSNLTVYAVWLSVYKTF